MVLCKVRYYFNSYNSCIVVTIVSKCGSNHFAQSWVSCRGASNVEHENIYLFITLFYLSTFLHRIVCKSNKWHHYQSTYMSQDVILWRHCLQYCNNMIILNLGMYSILCPQSNVNECDTLNFTRSSPNELSWLFLQDFSEKDVYILDTTCTSNASDVIHHRDGIVSWHRYYSCIPPGTS